jgi:hypothetical protein
VSGRIDTVPPPPPVEARLLRWLTDVRAALGLEAVRTPALENAWGAHPAYGTPGCFRRQGLVHLVGAAQGGTAGTAVFTLPAGFRPDATVRFDGPRVEVDAAGRVTPDAAAGNGRVALDGIIFRTGGS